MGEAFQDEGEELAELALDGELPGSAGRGAALWRTTVVAALALALLLVALVFVGPVGEAYAVAPGVGTRVTALVHAALAATLAAGALGLMLGASAGWWAAMLGSLAAALYHGKLVLYYVGSIRWDRPAADGLRLEVALRHGLPVALGLGLAVLLSTPSVRERFGLRQTEYRRRRRAPVSAGSSRRSSRR